MNVKTTIFLIVLLGAGAGAWFWLEPRSTEETLSPSATFLEQSLVADKITRIEAKRGDKIQFVLEKTGADWHLSGNWPARPQETEQWLATLTSLRSRFSATPLADGDDLKPFGLDDDPLTVKVSAGDETHALRFGEEPGDSNRFMRPTYVRLDNKAEVIRLGPGVLAALDRSQDYFRQRRLFPIERIAKEEGAKDKVEEVRAAEIEVETPAAKFTIGKKADEWILKEAYAKKDKDWKLVCSEDRLDPAKRDALLRGFPDLWAEKFVKEKSKSLKECGLTEPEYVLSVRSPGGSKIKLLIGKVSESKTRMAKAPPPPNPFGPPPKPPEFVTEEYRFAKLDKNDEIFEIKSDKLRDIAVELDDLRDPLLARFKTDDVKRLEIRHGDQEIVLVKVKENDAEKAKEKWRFEKPNHDDAEAKTVEEVLEKLKSVQARDKEIDDKIDPKSAGLDKPRGRIKITLEETDKDSEKKADDKDAKKNRVIVFHLGAALKDKVYVRVDDWPRVNQVGDDLWKLVSRTSLAYRPRELWRLERDAITRITIQADSTPYHLDRDEKGWKIGAPINAEVAGKEIEALAEELSVLQAERFEAINVKDLARFGLDKPAFKVSVTAKDGKPRVLEIGKRTESADGGRYARLGDGDAVFVLSDKITANIRPDALDFLDKTLWTLNPADIQKIRYQGTAPFTLEPKKGLWQVSESPAPPFSADDQAVKSAVGPLLQLRAQKYAAFGGKIDWTKFGLDKPVAVVTVTLKTGAAEKTIDRVVEVGQEAAGGGRYARVDKKDAVALLDAGAALELQRTHVDFVDTHVLKFDGDAVTSIERKMKDAEMKDADLELTRREDNWLITKPGTRDADLLTINDILRKTSQLQAKRIVAFPAKDLPMFGLDKPAAVVTLHLEAADGNTSKHVIKLGNFAKDAAKKDTLERYALIDDRPMVVLLSADLSRHLAAPAPYYADRNLASFSSVDRAELTSATRKAVFSRSETGWKMNQPVESAAEGAALDDLIRGLQRLRADEIVAEKGADLKKFGLDQPFLQWRFKSGDNDQLNLIVGAAENDQPGARRYAKLGDKNPVFLLSGKVTAKVQSEYRGRSVWTPFVSAAASKLTVINKDKTFALNRKDLKWELADEPTAKVNENALTNTLNILESLKAVRYVADAKADLKLYGLENPMWKIEIDVAKEKRVLWLGDYDGKTKHLYATVPGSGAVFVLDEIDGLILARPRTAYVEEEKKK